MTIRNTWARRCLVIGAALPLLLAACSRSSDSSSDDASIATAKVSASEVAKRAQELMTRPTTTTFMGPEISEPIPSGKVIYTVNCGQSTCTEIGKLVGEATAKIGWTARDLPTDGGPEQLANAWSQVIHDKPAGAIIEGSPLSIVGKYVAQATANGTVVIGEGILDTVDGKNGLTASIQSGDAFRAEGEYMAVWVADKVLSSDDQSAGILFVDLPDFPVLHAVEEGFADALPDYCPACDVESLQIGLSGIQSAPDQVISYLRAHPDVKYVAMSALNAFNAVPSAIEAAGLDVEIIGAIPDETSLNQLRAGTIDAAIAAPNYEEAYLGVDLVLRQVMGQKEGVAKQSADYTIPPWIMTKENVPSGTYFPIVEDLVDQFEASWGLN